MLPENYAHFSFLLSLKKDFLFSVGSHTYQIRICDTGFVAIHRITLKSFPDPASLLYCRLLYNIHVEPNGGLQIEKRGRAPPGYIAFKQIFSDLENEITLLDEIFSLIKSPCKRRSLCSRKLSRRS
ncbi:MAG: hypothetical protein A3F09_01730 [Chlamydiae bacterium RIFCSPHIGHO2_12_FULL_49_11]|nr:MAG: hypothetical protein A3F09_01730 [Chlamydiae bacterium RIFCSPHIGHO2_12_FULL_49_11]